MMIGWLLRETDDNGEERLFAFLFTKCHFGQRMGAAVGSAPPLPLELRATIRPAPVPSVYALAK